MVEKSIDKEVEVNNINDFLNAPKDTWIKVKGREEFNWNYSGPKLAITFSLEENYICRNHYEHFFSSLDPVYIEKFFKESGAGRGYLNMIEERGGKK